MTFNRTVVKIFKGAWSPCHVSLRTLYPYYRPAPGFKMATRGGVTRTCYTKIMNLFSSKILVQPLTGHVFFCFFLSIFFFCYFFLLFFFSFFFTFLLIIFFYLCIFFPLLFLTFSYTYIFFLVSILFFYFDMLGYLFVSLFTLPSVADITGNAVLAFTHNLTTCNA